MTQDQAVTSYPRREHVREIVTALVCLALWGAVWYITTDFPDRARTYPRFVLGSLIVLSSIHLIQATVRLVRSAKTSAADEVAPVSEEPTPEPRTLRLFALIAGSIAYVLLMPVVGFMVTTVAFLTLGVCLSIGWSLKRIMAVTGITVFLYVVVAVLLGIRVPSGILI